MMEVLPEEVSTRGFSGMLKSPPRIVHPKLKALSSDNMHWQNFRCEVFGKYTFANVMGISQHFPFKKIYLPSGSMRCVC